MPTSDSATTYLQYGCGKCAPPTWINFDSSPSLRLERLPVVGRRLFTPKAGAIFPANVRCGDIVRGLPVPMGSCQGVYCSHVLEHLALDDLRVALRHTYNLLRPGGCFRLVLPDLEAITRDYLADSTRETAGIVFVERLGLGRTARPRKPAAMLRDWLGGSHHLWMWDYAGLAQELTAAGFKRVRRAQCRDGMDAHFYAVEDPVRWDGSLGIEAMR